MNYETRVKMIKDVMVDILKRDDDLFVEACTELDSWNGFLGDDRCYNMSDIDDLLCGKKPSEIIDMITKDFDSSCEWFYFSIYGLESCDDIVSHYRDAYYESDVLESLIDNYNHISEMTDSDFEIVLEMLANGDEDAIMEDSDEDFLKGLEQLKELTY